MRKVNFSAFINLCILFLIFIDFNISAPMPEHLQVDKHAKIKNQNLKNILLDKNYKSSQISLNNEKQSIMLDHFPISRDKLKYINNDINNDIDLIVNDQIGDIINRFKINLLDNAININNNDQMPIIPKRKKSFKIRKKLKKALENPFDSKTHIIINKLIHKFNNIDDKDSIMVLLDIFNTAYNKQYSAIPNKYSNTNKKVHFLE